MTEFLFKETIGDNTTVWVSGRIDALQHYKDDSRASYTSNDFSVIASTFNETFKTRSSSASEQKIRKSNQNRTFLVGANSNDKSSAQNDTASSSKKAFRTTSSSATESHSSKKCGHNHDTSAAVAAAVTYAALSGLFAAVACPTREATEAAAAVAAAAITAALAPRAGEKEEDHKDDEIEDEEGERETYDETKYA